MVSDSEYWTWFDDQLKAEYRAEGGEPCVICGSPIERSAHWKQRDRHVCSPRCNSNLRRRLNRKVASGKVSRPSAVRAAAPEPREPRLFSTLPADAPFPYTFSGDGPRPGDVVERHGELIGYVPGTELKALPWWVTAAQGKAEKLMVAVHAASDSALFYEATPDGADTSLVYGIASTEGRLPLGTVFTVAGTRWRWEREIIRDINEEGERYSWRAWVCLPDGPARPTFWSPAYTEASLRQKRQTSALGAYQARMRALGLNGEAERVDPHEIFERDSWTCRLCGDPVDRTVKWPALKSLTLDHVIPVVAGGSHTKDNLQTAHWICNLRKGDTHSVET